MIKITRRQLLHGAGCLAGSVLLGENALGALKRKRRRKPTAKSRRPNSVGPLSGAKLYDDVISYYNLGEHRTATDVDLRTSDWLVEQLRAAGLRATTQAFSLRQFFIKQTRLTINENSIRAFPLWFPNATGQNSKTGELAFLETTAVNRSPRDKIALVTFPASAGAAMQEGSIHSRIIQEAANAGATAVVAITESATKEIVALNSPAGAAPWPIPVVVVGQRDEAPLTAALRSNTRIKLLLDGEDKSDAAARNVIARAEHGKDLIVVSTPQSGWFRCAGERGPGIALFLGLARWASRRTMGSSFLFISSSGHELGGLGMKAFLDQLAPKPERVLCWIHLGAGIATYRWDETPTGLRRVKDVDPKRLLMARSDLVPALASTFAGLPGLVPTTDRAVGEYEFMLKAGHRVFGIAAGHRFHHTPADSPVTTGPEILEPVGRALIRTIEALESVKS